MAAATHLFLFLNHLLHHLNPLYLNPLWLPYYPGLRVLSRAGLMILPTRFLERLCAFMDCDGVTDGSCCIFFFVLGLGVIPDVFFCKAKML